MDKKLTALTQLFAKQVEKGAWREEDVPSQLQPDVSAILEENKKETKEGVEE